MCFSAQADVLGGIVVGAIGVDVIRHVDHRRNYLAFAWLPLLLAAHQLVEAFVWWGLRGDVSAQVGHLATWVYLLFAFVVLPIYIPVAVFRLEPPGPRRQRITPFIGLGAVVAGLLLAAMVRGPVTAEVGHYHLSYGIGLDSGFLIIAAYVLATCGSLIFSGYRPVAVYGVVNLIAVAVLARLTIDGFASLWCGWAAICAGAIALQLRYGGRNRSLALT